VKIQNRLPEKYDEMLSGAYRYADHKMLSLHLLDFELIVWPSFQLSKHARGG